MYAKVFKSMFDGSLRGRSEAQLVFVNLIATADRQGVVDKHFRVIADETGLSIEAVKNAILELESPDPESRTPDLQGRRIERLDDHRDWGWRVVNYLHYRGIRDEETRREQNREAQDRYKRQSAAVSRDKPESAAVITSKPDKPKSAHAEAEAEAIYKIYPIKVAKPDAIRAIKKALARIPFEELRAKTEAYAKARNGDFLFCPNPATWFNQERYNDDPATWLPKNPVAIPFQQPRKEAPKYKWV